MSAAAAPLRVVFVCWGNICRSPMAERVAERAAGDRGLAGVEFTSAATSAEELGEPIDPRARRVLDRHGYRSANHVAHQITRDELESADLVVAMEDIHITRMRALSDAEVHLLSDFDPDAEPGSGVPDPWYGPEAGFLRTLQTIEAAMPGLLRRIEELRAARTPR